MFFYFIAICNVVLALCTDIRSLIQQRRDVLINDLYANNKLEGGCPITTRNVGDSLHISAECDEGASFAQFINENESDKTNLRRSFPSSVGINLKKLTKGILDEENLNFKLINVGQHMFRFSGSALNTLHFADGNIPISEVKIKKLEFEQGERDFCKVAIQMRGEIEMNGEQLEIQLNKKVGKCVIDVKIPSISTVTIEEFASTFKASVENIQILKETTKFKVNELKSIALSNPTVIGELTPDGLMQLVANAEATDENLSFSHENIFVVVNKKRGENPKIAIVFNIGKGKSMDDVFSSITSRPSRSSSFPIVGKLSTYEWALSITEGEDTAVAAPEPMLLPRGITARIEISKADYQNICKDKSEGIPDAVSIELRVMKSGRYLIKMTEGIQPDVHNFIACVTSEKNISIVIPEELTGKSTIDEAKINITQFYFNPRTSGFEMQLLIERNASFFYNLFRFENFDVRVRKENEKWLVVGTSKYKKSVAADVEKSYEVEPYISISRKHLDKESTIKVTLPTINADQLWMTLGGDKDEFEILAAFKKLTNFGLKGVVLHEENNGFRLSATAFLYGLNFQFEGFAWQAKSEPVKKAKQVKLKSKKDQSKVSNTVIAKNKKESGDSFTKDLKKGKIKGASNSTKVESKKVKKKLVEIAKILKQEDNRESDVEKSLREKSLKVSTKESGKLSFKSDKKNTLKQKNTNIHHLFRPAFFNINDNFTAEGSADEDHVSSTQKTSNKKNAKPIEGYSEPVKKISSITKQFHALPKADVKSDNTEVDFSNEIEQLANEETTSSLHVDGEGGHNTLEESINSLADSMKRSKKMMSMDPYASIFKEKRSKHFLHNSSIIEDTPVFKKTLNTKKESSKPHIFLETINDDDSFIYPDLSESMFTLEKNAKVSNRRRRDFINTSTRRSFDTVLKLNLVVAMVADDISFVGFLENMYEKPLLLSPVWLEKLTGVVVLSNTNEALPTKKPSKDSKKRGSKRSEMLKKANEFLDVQNDDDDFTFQPKFSFSFAEITQIKTERGVSVSFMMHPPENCRQDELCKWIKERLAVEERIVLAGRASRRNVYLDAALHLRSEFTSNDNMNIQSVNLIVSCNELAPDYCGITLSLRLLMKHPISFATTAIIRTTSSGQLVLEAKSSKQKPKPGITIGEYSYQDIVVHQGVLSSGVDFFNAKKQRIEVRAVVALGKPNEDGNEDHMVKFKKAFLFIEPTLVSCHYLIAESPELSMQSLIAALRMDVTLPTHIINTAFPNGVKLTLTSNGDCKGLQDDVTGLDINYGLNIIGNIRIFEFFVPSTVSLFRDKIAVNVKLNPMDIMGGVVRLRRSKRELYKGAIMNIEISNGATKSTIKGLVDVLGNRVVANIDIEQVKQLQIFTFKFSGSIYQTVPSELAFKAKFFGQVLKLEFEFSGCFARKDIQDIESKILQKVTMMTELATTLKSTGNQLWKSISSGVKDASVRTSAWKRNINDYEERLKLKMMDIKDEKNKIKQSCDEKCGDVCISYFGWNNQCFSIWGTWIACPGWDNCKWKKKDAICIASCELEKTSRKIILWGDRLGIDAYIGLTEVPKEFASLTHDFESSYKTLESLAKEVNLNLASNLETYFELKRAVEDQKSGMTIKNICFYGYLNKYWKSLLFCNISATIYELPLSWEENVYIGMDVYDRLAESILRKRFPELFNTDLRSFQTTFENVAKQRDEFEKNKNILQNKIDDLLSKSCLRKVAAESKGTRGYVSSKEQMQYRSIIEEPITYDKMSAASMRTYQTSSPWSLLQEFDYEMNDVPMYLADTSVQSAESRSLDSCQQMRRVVEKYDKLTQGMKQFASSAEYQRQMYQSNKKSYLESLASMRNTIHEVEVAHNLTVADLQDLFFWYNNVRYGLEEWNAKSEEIYLSGQKKGLTAFKNQMDFVLKREKSSNVRDYLAKLHADGLKAYKRSNLPNFSTIKGGLFLGEIKKSILDLYNDVDSTLEEFTEKIGKTESQIEQLKVFMQSCQ